MKHLSQRLLLCYKGDISALVLFAQHGNGSICFPQPLPALSVVLEQKDTRSKVTPHPAMLLPSINQLLQLDNDLLQIETGFSEQINSADGTITVHLARFQLLDPPHKRLQSRDCKLRTLPELRHQPAAEMDILRRAYQYLMEG